MMAMKSPTSSIPILPRNVQLESEDILWTAELCWGHCLKQDFQDISDVQNLHYGFLWSWMSITVFDSLLGYSMILYGLV